MPGSAPCADARVLWSTRLRQSHRCAVLPTVSGESIVFELRHPDRQMRLSFLQRAVYMLFPCGTSALAPSDCEITSIDRDLAASPDRVLELIRPLVDFKALVPALERTHVYPGEMAAAYAASRRPPPEIPKRIIDAAAIHESSRVLDIGSGTGELAIALAERSRHVTGIDVCASLLAVARQSAERCRSRARFLDLDANTLCFTQGRFDVVILSQAIHWLNPYWVAQGISRVLEDGGTLFIVETNAMVHAEHPLRKLLGYGFDTSDALADAATATIGRSRTCLQALAQPSCELVHHDLWSYSHSFQFDLSFARATVFPQQVKALFPDDPSPDVRFREAFHAVPPHVLAGEMNWVVAKSSRRDRAGIPPRKATC